MLKKLVVLWILVGLLGKMPVQAAEDCNVKSESGKDARDCALKVETVRQTNERIEGAIDKSSTKDRTEEQKQLKKDLKEGNDILDELIK